MSEIRAIRAQRDYLDAVLYIKGIRYRMRWRGANGKEIEARFYRGATLDGDAGVLEREIRTAARLPKRVRAWFLAVSELERSWQKRPRK